MFLNTFVQRRKDCNQQNMYYRICESSKLCNYVEYKSSLSIEYYLCVVPEREYRRLLCLLRICELPLMVNIGRRCGIHVVIDYVHSVPYVV